jgi:hypothetical protein
MRPNIWTLDLRSLALLRVALALMVLLDLYVRLLDLTLFYTDQGLLPRSAFPGNKALEIGINFHLCCGDAAGQALLFLATAAAAVGLMVGWNTRWCAFATWLLVSSMQFRNPVVLDGGDLELRVVLFWLMLLPVEARWSLDSLSHQRSETDSHQFSSLASLGYQLQIAIVYGCAGLLKTDPLWMVSGDALYYTLSIDQFTTGFAKWLLNYPEQLRVLSFAALLTEYLIPLLIFCPVYRPVSKLAAVMAILALHLGIASCLHLGNFVPIAIAASLGLLPAFVMDKVERYLKAQFSGLKLNPSRECKFSCAPSLANKVISTTTIAYLICYNAAFTIKAKSLPYPVLLYGRLTLEQQRWDFFAPKPFTADGWFILDGQTVAGQHIDLMNGGKPLDWAKPALVSAQFANQRHRRWMQNLYFSDVAGLRQSSCDWWLKDWNQRNPGPQQITSLNLVYVLEETVPPGEQPKVFSQILASSRADTLSTGGASSLPTDVPRYRY